MSILLSCVVFMGLGRLLQLAGSFLKWRREVLDGAHFLATPDGVARGIPRSNTQLVRKIWRSEVLGGTISVIYKYDRRLRTRG